MLHAHFTTSEGVFTVKLFDDKAPKTVENFVGLAEGTKEYRDPATGQKKTGPYYDGIVFHRVVPDFVIQGGDPTGTGEGDPGYSDITETPKNGYPLGTLAWAKKSTACASQKLLSTSPKEAMQPRVRRSAQNPLQIMSRSRNKSKKIICYINSFNLLFSLYQSWASARFDFARCQKCFSVQNLAPFSSSIPFAAKNRWHHSHFWSHECAHWIWAPSSSLNPGWL